MGDKFTNQSHHTHSHLKKEKKQELTNKKRKIIGEQSYCFLYWWTQLLWVDLIEYKRIRDPLYRDLYCYRTDMNAMTARSVEKLLQLDLHIYEYMTETINGDMKKSQTKTT